MSCEKLGAAVPITNPATTHATCDTFEVRPRCAEFCDRLEIVPVMLMTIHPTPTRQQYSDLSRPRRQIQSVSAQRVKLGDPGSVDANGERVWSDFCVVESIFGGPTLACDWLDFDPETRTAFLAGTEPGKIVGRREMEAAPRPPRM